MGDKFCFVLVVSMNSALHSYTSIDSLESLDNPETSEKIDEEDTYEGKKNIPRYDSQNHTYNQLQGINQPTRCFEKKLFLVF